MDYSGKLSVSGSWLKGDDVQNGTRAKLVSECLPSASQFKNKDGSVKMQDVAKIQVDGMDEVKNISINRASLNALASAFGTDSVKWQGHSFTIRTEKVQVAGKRQTVMYLVPDGYEVGEDAGGYVVIKKIGEKIEKSFEDELNGEMYA